MGARPMARVIQEYIKKPLAEILLFGALEKSAGVVVVSVEDGELTVRAEVPEAEVA
jgi:ATP-dependent Clp protease ATP-binding subunit ClpA